MALRLLSGPNKIVDDEGNLPLTMNLSSYYPGRGLLAYGYYDYYKSTSYHWVTFDGVSQRCPMAGTATSELGWWVVKKRMVSYPGFAFNQPEIVWEPKVFMAQNAEDPGTGLLNPPGGLAHKPYVRLSDRWLYGDSTRINVVRQNGTSYTNVQEGPVWPFTLNGLRPGRSDIEVLGIGINHDRARFYDVERHEFTSDVLYLGMTANCLVFAPEWGVLVSGHSNEPFDEGNAYAIRVWSLEVNPIVLSDPAPWFGTVKSGQIVTYATVLAGAQGDPAADEFVNWQLGGAGVLLDVQSKTNAAGRAFARVQYRVGETGTSTVQASVQC